MLTKEGCLNRQARLRDALEVKGIDLAVITSVNLVYYFTGVLADPKFPQVLVLRTDGKSCLVTNIETRCETVSRLRSYEFSSIERVVTRQTIAEEAAHLLKEELCGFYGPRRVGIEFESAGWLFGSILVSCWPKAELINLTPFLIAIRRHKEADELSCIRASIELVEAGFQEVKPNISPGRTEWEIYNLFYSAVVKQAETSVPFSGDFACGKRVLLEGGVPTNRRIEKGDLFILDIFPCYRGYYADLSRTFAASPESDNQSRAWEIVRGALRLAEKMIRPGVRGADIWRSLREYLDQYDVTRGSFKHHAGHGIGLEGQEFPWLTPGSDHVLQEGDVIAVEPGLYSEALNGGIRLENDYLVCAKGVEALSKFPLDLC